MILASPNIAINNVIKVLVDNLLMDIFSITIISFKQPCNSKSLTIFSCNIFIGIICVKIVSLIAVNYIVAKKFFKAVQQTVILIINKKWKNIRPLISSNIQNFHILIIHSIFNKIIFNINLI